MATITTFLNGSFNSPDNYVVGQPVQIIDQARGFDIYDVIISVNRDERLLEPRTEVFIPVSVSRLIRPQSVYVPSVWPIYNHTDPPRQRVREFAKKRKKAKRAVKETKEVEPPTPGKRVILI
jgi:hypothetical protein